jgi:RNA polymerase sigma-70 factor (ECF subfamily)
VSEQALNQLCTRYWFPLYAFARRQGCDPEAAQDAVQGFFARLLLRRDLESIRREKGRFRTFLLTSMKNFLVNSWNHERAQKRGGGVAPVCFDTTDGEARYVLEPADSESPDKVFARRWALTVLELVLDQLRAEFETTGRQQLFDALQGFLSDDNPPSQAATAARLGLSEAAVKQSIYRMRQRYRELLREEIGRTVAAPDEIEDELRFLIDSLRR